MVNYRLDMNIAADWDINLKPKNWVNKSRSSTSTVNLEIFARVLFSWNFTHGKFPENKTLAKVLFIDVGKNHAAATNF